MRVIHLKSVGSTNDEVIRLAQSGEALPFWVVTDEQTNGRGRRGRQWQGLDGNLFASGIYEFTQEPAEIATLSFVVSYSLFETLCEYIDKNRIALKWPNDVLVDGKKISGILLESQIKNKIVQLVIGVGLNIIHAPIINEYGTTSIKDCALEHANNLEKMQILNNFLQRLKINLSHWQEFGAADIIDAWKKYAFKINRTIKIAQGNNLIIGEMIDIAHNGEIILRSGDGEIYKINAGEVLL